MAPPGRLVLVDGLGAAYRMFHALQSHPLTSARGVDTTAVFGFARFLLRTIREIRPTQIAVVFDGPSSRLWRDSLVVATTPALNPDTPIADRIGLVQSQIHACKAQHSEFSWVRLTPDTPDTVAASPFVPANQSTYKAKRSTMPAPLRQGLPLIKRLLAVLGVPAFQCRDVEADDMIASLAMAAASGKIVPARGGPPLDLHTCILSNDKDFFQLIGPRVSVSNPFASRTSVLGDEITEERFESQWELKPSQFADVLALWGDAADGIAGVPGIGRVKATKLIREFGSIDNMLKHTENITPPRLRAAIEENIPVLLLNQQLIRPRLALDQVPDAESLQFSSSLNSKDDLVDLFRELNFACFWEDLEDIYQCSFSRNETNTRLQKRPSSKFQSSPFAGMNLRVQASE
eukprot:m.58101 g.58101  ORF g.58101 m.58101 type:complete len:404 (+) comp7120_c0_seq1:80-1291(+)